MSNHANAEIDLDKLDSIFGGARYYTRPLQHLTVDQLDDVIDAIAELRASRRVVEAADRYMECSKGAGDEDDFERAWSDLDAALSEHGRD